MDGLEVKITDIYYVMLCRVRGFRVNTVLWLMVEWWWYIHRLMVEVYYSVRPAGVIFAMLVVNTLNNCNRGHQHWKE